MPGNNQSGIKLRERLEGEPPLVQARVRNLKAGLVDRLVAVEEQVEVDRAGAETGADAPDAAQTSFDLEQTLEQHARRKLGLD